MTFYMFLQLIEEGLTATTERRRLSPDFGVYLHAESELLKIREIARNLGKIPALRTDIGIMAAKELDVDDPDFADILHKIAYAMRQKDA